MNNDTVIECRHLNKSFQDGKLSVEVLNDINLVVHAGEQVAIVGASGAGKSTLLHLLGGLERPSEGEVLISGQNINQLSERDRSALRNKSLGFVYQFHHLLPEFTLLENVCMPLLIRKTPPKIAIERAERLLEKVRLTHRIHHKLGELSGGERQRTAIIRALITEPQCVLADEPTGNLDHRTAEQVYETMLVLNQELSTSIIIVTHDHTLANRMDRVLEMDSGKIVGVG